MSYLHLLAETLPYLILTVMLALTAWRQYRINVRFLRCMDLLRDQVAWLTEREALRPPPGQPLDDPSDDDR